MAYSAYEASRMVFEEHFLKGSHVEMSNNNSSHKGELSFRFALDAMFLATFHNVAKQRGYANLSDVLSKLQRSIDYIYNDLNANQYWKTGTSNNGNSYSSPSLGLMFHAMLIVKKFAYNDLTTNARRGKVDWLIDEAKYWLNNTYLTVTSKNHTCTQGITYADQIRNKQYCTTNYTPTKAGGSTYNKGGISINIPALHGAGLALESDLFNKNVSGGVVTNDPTSYQFRSRIVEIGNYVKDAGFTDPATGARLSAIGGARTISGMDEGQLVSAGYTSWHGMALALMAHGTVYNSSFAGFNNSMYMQEAKNIQKGFQVVFNNMGRIPEVFAGFDQDVIPSGKDSREYLYSLAWTGDQSFIDWLDGINAQKHSVMGEPVIVRVARTSKEENDTLEGNFHRALHGLTAGLLLGLNFN